MKFTITRSKFLEGLKSVQNIVPSKGSLQILQNVMIKGADNRLILTTTDFDISVQTEVECEIKEPGSTTLPVKTLFDIASRVSDNVVEVEVDENDNALITSGRSVYKVKGMSVIDFPPIPNEEGSFSYKIQQVKFKDMLRKTGYAITQDETRKTLRGLLMSFQEGKLTMVATDGRRLAMVSQEVEFPVDANRDVILPAKTIAELPHSLSNSGDVNIKIEKTQITFNLGSTKIFSKLLDQVYPNYRQVIPASMPCSISIDRQMLLDALNRVSIMANDQTNAVQLVFDDNKLMVFAKNNDMGNARDEVPIKYAGEKVEIMFNPNYVIEPLKSIDEDEVSFELNNGHSPVLIRCSVPFLYVLMPLRFN